MNESSKLVHSPYFKTDIINIDKNLTIDYSEYDSFVIYMCVEGDLEIENDGYYNSLNKGETMLFPATVEKVNLKSNNAKVIAVYF